MVYPFEYIQHKRDVNRKQAERAAKIASLPPKYLYPLTRTDSSILSRNIKDLVEEVHQKTFRPVDILRAYGKVAVEAHNQTNCLTEILFPEAEEWLERHEVNLKGPLAGIPVSLKDSIAVGGFDVSVGYSCKTGKPCEVDGPMVRLLKDAGAIPFVKTNVPTTLLSFETSNDVWGRTKNPHNHNYSPGGSTGGEAALLAWGGGRIGIGSDVAGSVRLPAHWSGCYALRCSTGRWPKRGVDTSTAGQDGVPSVFSPMARTLNDLAYFTKSLIQMKPWKYDHSVHQLAWRDDIESEFRKKKRLRIGVMRDDGVVPPTPACARALETVVYSLRADGHEVYDVAPPSPYDGLVLASQLIAADGCRTFMSHLRPGETNDPGAGQMEFYMNLPRPFKFIYWLFVKYVKRDDIWAGLLAGWYPKSTHEHWKLNVQREEYKSRWHEWWEHESRMDCMISVPNATPALPHGAMKQAMSSCGYTFLFNLLDYTAGVVPVTHVDKTLDELPTDFDPSAVLTNAVSRGAYKYYDAEKMDGLPVGIQVIGQRLEEEKVLAVMKRIEHALDKTGRKYKRIELDLGDAQSMRSGRSSRRDRGDRGDRDR